MGILVSPLRLVRGPGAILTWVRGTVRGRRCILGACLSTPWPHVLRPPTSYGRLRLTLRRWTWVRGRRGTMSVVLPAPSPRRRRLAQMLLQECDGAAPGEIGGRLVVARRIGVIV